ncbi:hypothetical protein N0V83_008168 [Neocucurbitaria cava]|uniref:BTB domain-containing protein n=1 Tax=Neocucurbitaria cava TaxID=798079 RepID=A0A9W8Y439_9PLEO|nr:hypothetical protein N0V83_008168 [Neocucurbitaria cava]
MSNPYTPDISGDIIDVKVGDQTFQVHKGVISSVPFFQNALKPEWCLGRNGDPIDLSDHDPEAFEHYLQWLYSRNLAKNLPLTLLASLYITGDSLMDTAFQNAVIDCFKPRNRRESDRMVITAGAVNIIYDGTLAGSPARQLLVDVFCWRDCSMLIKGNVVDEYHPDFVNDAFLALADNRRAPRGTAPWLKALTSYHVQKLAHDNDREDEGSSSMDDNSGEEEDKENEETSSGKKGKRETQ